MKKAIKIFLIILLLLICSIMIVGSFYYVTNYPKQEFDEILFYMLNGAEYTSPSVINNVIKFCIVPIIILTCLFFIPLIESVKNKLVLNIKCKEKKHVVQLFPIKHKALYLTVIFIFSFLFTIFSFKIPIYIKNKIQKTYIYDDYLIDAKTINLVFPEEKQNLILIVVESMENTVLSRENRGAWDYSLTPELESLALENINFSNTDKIGGPFTTYGTTFTSGGLVAQTAGIPLVTPSLLSGDINIYEGNGNYLSGAYTLGEILEEAGYVSEIMMGSDGNFGGRTQYFTTNGNYKIFDLNYAEENGFMTKEEEVWWGFEDDKLFEWSKHELLDLAKSGKPFNYLILTADTHFTDGYLSEKAEKKYDSQYENVYAYSSKCINDFVNWIKTQDFYKNTTIVIVGDHLGMQNDFYVDKAGENYARTVYNVIINSRIPATNSKNRIFTTIDMFPTILASLGIKIEGDRLGLGTNLFSEKPTLAEELGLDYLDKELHKNSLYYNEYILGDDYYVIKKTSRNLENSQNKK